MDRVRGYYQRFSEREWTRLENQADGALELEFTRRALFRHLPAPPAKLLDIGGGPGRYAIDLSARGYTVTLADLSPDLLRLAAHHASEAGVQLAELVETDARDLSRWSDESFDAALAMGPFYHLQTESDRNRAISELHRVIRPGGFAFVAFMPLMTLFRRTLAIDDERHRLFDSAWLEALLDRGVFDNDVPGRFDHGWGAQPKGIQPFMSRNGFAMVELRSAEGPAPGLQQVVNNLVAAERELLLDVLERLGTDESNFGCAAHLLYVGRRI